MKYLGLITARSGSKRIPGKNIKLLGGYPLIWYTIHEAVNSKLRQKGNAIALSTDDPAILAVAALYFNAFATAGTLIPVLRPAEIARDDTPHLPVVQHAVEFFGKDKFDAVVTLQPTSPFRSATHIDDAIIAFEKAGGKNLVSVNDAGVRNAAIYITPVADLYDGHPFIYREDSATHDMGGSPQSIDINTPEDFLLAESFMQDSPILYSL